MFSWLFLLLLLLLLLLLFFLSSFLSSSCYLTLAISFFLFRISSSYYLLQSNNYIITAIIFVIVITIIVIIIIIIIIIVIIIIMLIILPLQVFLKNQVRESSKQGIQVAWSTLIHNVKWWISHFRDMYRTLTTSEGELFLMLLKGFWQLCNATRSFLLVVVAVLYLPLQFIIIIITLNIITIIITFIIIIIIIIAFVSFLSFSLLLKFLSRTVYCSYEVSWLFGFASFNFFICLNLIHANTIWCWHTTLILSFGIT